MEPWTRGKGALRIWTWKWKSRRFFHLIMESACDRPHEADKKAPPAPGSDGGAAFVSQAWFQGPRWITEASILDRSVQPV